MQVTEILAEELAIPKERVEAVIKLLDEGNTIPFIARYRKEMTGGLRDETLRQLEERLGQIRSLLSRKEEVLRLVKEQGNWSEAWETALNEAATLARVEDLYRPFRPKKRTRATLAREKGLLPLAEKILAQESMSREEFEDFEKNHRGQAQTQEEARAGALDILAEMISDEPENRALLKRDLRRHGRLSVQLKAEEDQLYEIYHDFEEAISNLKAHQILAINRGEKEGCLRVKLVAPLELLEKHLAFHLIQNETSPTAPLVKEALLDSLKRLILPSLETEIRGELRERAEAESIEAFAKNIKPALLQPPIRNRVVMGIDPGYRTGCKVAVVSSLGELLDYATIYPTKPREDISGAGSVVLGLVKKHGVSLISIGNKTASRETESFVADLIREHMDDVHYVMTNEAGASIYSASALGQQEFPDLDVTIRGAVSLARRVQDPLAELVKIEPKHLGVGQYQHDVNQKALGETLEHVVEDCVNSVGVDVNTASVALLSYVSGLGKKIAENIISHKEQEGAFENRKELLKVKGLGQKTYTQCAGFLRIPGAKNPLDNTAVHPESYALAQRVLEAGLEDFDPVRYAKDWNVGEMTLQDILEELQKPGRDPREELPPPLLRRDVLQLSDLKEGMELTGTVRNVVDFGAFVDIGVKEEGLVHISKLGRSFVKNPYAHVRVGDILKVRVLEVDEKRRRISLERVFEKKKKS